jgi:DNA repair and recombination protein RAD54B
MVSPTMFKPKGNGDGVLSSSNVNSLKRANSTEQFYSASKRPASSSGDIWKYNVMIRKVSNKKHKTWEDDGIMLVQGNGSAVVKDSEGLVVGRLKVNREKIQEEDILSVGKKEVMIDGEAEVKEQNSVLSKPMEKPAVVSKPNTLNMGTMSPFFGSTTSKKNGSRHDPNREGAIVFSRPPPSKTGGNEIVDVVLDPILGDKLRSHQVDGVKFLYECVMGYRDNMGGQGALLADDMGLGKTLMTISLLWTLFKQSPYQGKNHVIKKAVVVCPVTLIDNWKREFTRWLGSLRLRLFVVNAKVDVRDFVNSNVYQVMVVGYDRLRIASDVLKMANIDIIVCDEAQKLKNSDSKATKSILSLNTPRRVMLSGTPIQNNLSEFYAMADFLNPGILGKANEFKKEYETPILRAQDPHATQKNRERGEEKLNELIQKTKGFVLRRTAETIKGFLPPKTETILFCTPTAVQKDDYLEALQSQEIKESIETLGRITALAAITKLKKICNSPLLNNRRKKSNSSLLSGKLAALKLMLLKLRQETDEKVVIVSTSTKTLDLVELMLEHLKLTNIRLDGNTKTTDRQKFVDQFNNSSSTQIFAFLLSAKSGGTGLNLIGASRLFLIDGDWNPTVDEQAMARIHRDGQKLPVFIYRLLLTGTIDEKIYQRQITKKGLASRFMEDGATGSNGGIGDKSSNSFTSEELHDLFKLHEHTISNTHDLLGCACSQDGAEAVFSQNSNDSIDNEDDGENTPEGLGGFMNAKEVAEKGPYVPKRLRASERLKRLLEYRHINPEPLLTDDVKLSNVGDEILQSVLKESSSKPIVSFMFTKSNLENES